MAIIGFIVVLLAALFFIMVAGIVFFANRMIAGVDEWLPTILFGTIGGVLLYWAFKWSPFVVSMV